MRSGLRSGALERNDSFAVVIPGSPQLLFCCFPVKRESVSDWGQKQKVLTPQLLQGALFESSHYDENDVQTISHKCEVVEYDELLRRDADTEEEQVYYLAGQYDPVVGSIVFSPHLFK